MDRGCARVGVISEPIPKKTNTIKTKTLRALPDYIHSFAQEANESNESK